MSTTTCSLEEKVIGVEENVEPDCIGVADKSEISKSDSSQPKVDYVPQIKWPDLLVQIFIHGGCLYGLYLTFTQAKALTSLWGEKHIFYYLILFQS